MARCVPLVLSVNVTGLSGVHRILLRLGTGDSRGLICYLARVSGECFEQTTHLFVASQPF